jgi:hypothetical protein
LYFVRSDGCLTVFRIYRETLSRFRAPLHCFVLGWGLAHACLAWLGWSRCVPTVAIVLVRAFKAWASMHTLCHLQRSAGDRLTHTTATLSMAGNHYMAYGMCTAHCVSCLLVHLIRTDSLCHATTLAPAKRGGFGTWIRAKSQGHLATLHSSALVYC